MTNHFSSLFDLLPIGAYRSSPAGQQLRANPALVRLNGYETEADMLACVGDIATEWYCDKHRRAEFTRQLQTHGRVVDFVSQVYRHKTRERIWIREHAHQVCDELGRVLFFEGTVQDITLEHQSRLDLEASEKRFRAMTELSTHWYWELDASLHFTRLDVGQHGISEWVNQEVLGKTRQQLPHIELSESQWADYQALMDARQVFYDFEFPIRQSPEKLVWHAISGEPMFNEAGEFVGFRGIGRDVTIRREAEELVRQLAFHDPLTGLANRRLFMDRLGKALTCMARSGHCGVLMFLDLDRFKALNDSQGHGFGDLLLQQVAQRLTGCVRGVDTVARLGGDEFTILLQDAGSLPDVAARHATLVAEKILQALQAPYLLGDWPVQFTHQCSASLGVIVLDNTQDNPEACLKLVDAAMYRAKADGRNRICLVAPE